MDSEQATPTFFSFILTNEQGNRVYGACLTMYEPLPKHLKEKLEPSYNIKEANILGPKALCIISCYSFISQYKEILKQLYRLHLSHSAIPIERYICNFTDEIPTPAKGRDLVQYEMGSSLISFCRPLDQIPPYASVPFLQLRYRAKTMSIYSDR